MTISVNSVSRIRAEIERAATEHLNSTDAGTALGHIADDVVAVTNMTLFSSEAAFASDVRDYFASLRTVNHASWADVQILVISETVATFTARFRYGYTDNNGETFELGEEMNSLG